MFTGIVTHVGEVIAVELRPQGKRFTVQADLDYASLDIGASIAHAGVCLTVISINPDAQTYQVEAWEEALRLTTAGSWDRGTRLNLERALRVGDELGGHIVSGHVDGMAHILAIEDEGDARRFRLNAPNALAKFIAPKGSVALDGTSLTVNGVQGTVFDVLLIAHSLSVTTWGSAETGDLVNLEVDTMARYAARLVDANDRAEKDI